MEQTASGTLPRSIRLLLADDNPFFLESALRFLSLFTWLTVVGKARTGQEAYRLTRRLRPDLVLLDLRLPDLDGLEISRRIKKLPDAPYVILVTLHDSPELRWAAESAQLDGFVNKVKFTTTLIPIICKLYNRPIPN